MEIAQALRAGGLVVVVRHGATLLLAVAASHQQDRQWVAFIPRLRFGPERYGRLRPYDLVAGHRVVASGTRARLMEAGKERGDQAVANWPRTSAQSAYSLDLPVARTPSSSKSCLLFAILVCSSHLCKASPVEILETWEK
jgi:hypothetical protein